MPLAAWHDRSSGMSSTIQMYLTWSLRMVRHLPKMPVKRARASCRSTSPPWDSADDSGLDVESLAVIPVQIQPVTLAMGQQYALNNTKLLNELE